MILLRNDFGGIVKAVFEGRRIFSNLKRSFSYLVSFHSPVILLALVPPLLGWGNLFLPIHIVLLKILVHPVSAFTFENLEAIPGERGKGLMTRRSLLQASISGLLLPLGSLILFGFHTNKKGLDSAGTTALSAILIGNIFFVFAESWPIHAKRLYITACSLIVLTLIAIFFLPFAGVLHFGPVEVIALIIALESAPSRRSLLLWCALFQTLRPPRMPVKKQVFTGHSSRVNAMFFPNILSLW